MDDSIYLDDSGQRFAFLGEVPQDKVELIQSAIDAETSIVEVLERNGIEYPRNDEWVSVEDCNHVSLLPLVLCDDPAPLLPFVHQAIYVSDAHMGETYLGRALIVEMGGYWYGKSFYQDGFDGEINFPTMLAKESPFFSNWLLLD